MKRIPYKILNTLIREIPKLYEINTIKNSYKSHHLESVEATYRDLSDENFEFLEYAMNDPRALYRESYGLKNYASRGIRGVMNPWPLFINNEKLNEIENVAVCSKRILDKLGTDFLIKNPSFVSAFFDIPIGEVEEQILRNVAHLGTSISRGDFVDTPDGFECLEYNISTDVGGFQGRIAKEIYKEEDILNAFVGKRMKSGYGSLDTLNLALRHLIELCEEALSEFRGEVNVLFFDNGQRNFSKAQFEYLMMEFRLALGMTNKEYTGNIFTAYPKDLRIENNKVYHGNTRIHVVLDMSLEVPSEVLSLAETGNVILFNSPITGLLGNKMSMALLSDDKYGSRKIFNEEEIKFIDKHIPWSRVVRDEVTYYKGKKISLLKFIVDNRRELVMKVGRGYGGFDVYIGKEKSKSDWGKILQEATEKGSWVVQEYCESKPYLMQYGRFGTRLANVIWGLFVFGGKYSGNMLRLGSKDRTSVINVKQEAEVAYAMHLPS